MESLEVQRQGWPRICAMNKSSVDDNRMQSGRANVFIHFERSKVFRYPNFICTIRDSTSEKRKGFLFKTMIKDVERKN